MMEYTNYILAGLVLLVVLGVLGKNKKKGEDYKGVALPRYAKELGQAKWLINQDSTYKEHLKRIRSYTYKPAHKGNLNGALASVDSSGNLVFYNPMFAFLDSRKANERYLWIASIVIHEVGHRMTGNDHDDHGFGVYYKKACEELKLPFYKYAKI